MEGLLSTRLGTERSPTVLVIFASTLVSVMGVSLISPALPTIQAAWNVSTGQASLLISAFTFPGIVLTPIIGLVSDRIGRKQVLVPSLFLFGISGFAVVFVESFTTVLVLRVVQGTAGSAIMSLTVTLLGDIFASEQRRRFIGLNAAILAIGAAGYPLLGGGLALISWTVPFICFALAIVVAVAGSAILPDPEGELATFGLSYFVNAARAIPTRTALALYTAIFGIFIILYGAQLTVVPFVLDESYGLSSGAIGLLLGLPAVTMGMTSSQSSRLLGYLSPLRLVALGFLIYGVGLSIVALTDSVFIFAGALFLFGIGQGFAEPTTDTALNALTPDAFRGGVMSIRTSILQFGTTVGPPLFVAVASLVGYSETLLVAGVAAFAIGVTSIVFLALFGSERAASAQSS